METLGQAAQRLLEAMDARKAGRMSQFQGRVSERPNTGSERFQTRQPPQVGEGQVEGLSLVALHLSDRPAAIRIGCNDNKRVHLRPHLSFGRVETR